MKTEDKFVLLECHSESRLHSTQVADVIIQAINAKQALKFIGDAMRKEFAKMNPVLENNPISVTCSYLDNHDGLTYQKEFTLIGTFSSSEEAEECKKADHEAWPMMAAA